MAGIGPMGLNQLGKDADWESLNGLTDIVNGKGGPLSKLLGTIGTVATEPKIPVAPPQSAMQSGIGISPDFGSQYAQRQSGGQIPVQLAQTISPTQAVQQPDMVEQFKKEHPELAAWATGFSQQGQ